MTELNELLSPKAREHWEGEQERRERFGGAGCVCPLCESVPLILAAFETPMVTNEMVERGAKAAWEYRTSLGPWRDGDEHDREGTRKQVRLALAAALGDENRMAVRTPRELASGAVARMRAEMPGFAEGIYTPSEDQWRAAIIAAVGEDRLRRSDTERESIPQVHRLNGVDWSRIEAAVRDLLEDWKPGWSPQGKLAWERTLRKIERVNGHGKFTYKGRTWPHPAAGR